MKTIQNHFLFKLCEERKLLNLRKAPKGPKAHLATKEALGKMTPEEAFQAEAMARDRIARLSQAIKQRIKENPNNKQLKEVHKRLMSVDKRLKTAGNRFDFTKKQYAKEVGNTILALNKVIDSKMPEIRKKILETSLQALGKTDSINQKWANAMVSTFSIMKYNEQLTYGKMTLTRAGKKLTVKKGKTENTYTFDAQNLGGTEIRWKILDIRGDNVRMGGRNPLRGLYGEGDLYGRMSTKIATPLKGREKPKKPKKVVKKAPEIRRETREAREAREKQTRQKIAEALKFFINPPEYNATIPAEMLRTFKDYVKGIPKDGVKHFKLGNVEAYITRSNDGRAFRITSRLVEKGITTRTTQVFVNNNVQWNLPKGYKSKFKEDPIYKGMDEPDKKPKQVTKKPPPGPKGISSEEGDRAYEKNRAARERAEQLLKWGKKVITALGKLIKKTYNLTLYRKLVANERGGVDKRKRKQLGKFRYALRQISEDVRLQREKSPAKIKKRFEDAIASYVPKKHQPEIRNDFPSPPLFKRERPTVPAAGPRRKPKRPAAPGRRIETTERPKTYHPLIREKARKYIDKVIDKNTFKLKGVTKVQIQQVLELPKDKSVSITITRRNGTKFNAVYARGDKTYYTGKNMDKRALIYNGDTIHVKKIYSHATKAELRAAGKLSPLERRGLQSTAREVGKIYKKYKTMDIRKYSPQDQKIVKENLAYISRMHKQKGVEGTYRIGPSATLQVDKHGTINGSDIGRFTLHYPISGARRGVAKGPKAPRKKREV